MKQYKYQTGIDAEILVALCFGRYQNGAMAIRMDTIPDMEPYGVITKTFDGAEPLNARCVFLDENNFPGIGEWIEKNDIGVSTGRAVLSGFCQYPEYYISANDF